MYARRGRRWVHRTLAAVDPSALADSVESYVGLLPANEVRDLSQRAFEKMSPADRTQFGLYLDRKSITDGTDGLLARRFTAFLRQNPRAIESLGSDALEQILAPLAPAETFEQPRRPVSLTAAALAILALAVAVVPLAAQYAHQRGMLQGLTDPQPAPATAPLVAKAAAAAPPRKGSKPAAGVQPRRSAPAARRPAANKRNVAQRRVAAVQGHRPAIAPVRRVNRHTAVPARRIAAAWKFDPRNYKYFDKPANRFQERARLTVQSYLNAVIAGDTRTALAHLGLPPDAGLVNLSEVPIISRNSHARVIMVKPAGAGTTQVEADIKGRRGEYFEVFQVAEDGPALRITDHYYIPVGK